MVHTFPKLVGYSALLFGFACSSAAPSMTAGATGAAPGGATSGGAAGVSGAPPGGNSAAGNGGASESAAGSSGAPFGGSAGASAVGGTDSGNAGAGRSGAGAGGGAGAAMMPAFPALLGNCDVAGAESHADTALGATLANFWSGSDEYLRATSPSNGNLTGYWTYAQIFDAVLDGVERTSGRHFAGLIHTFYTGRAARGWLTGYYDDEAWMTLALMRAYDLTSDQSYLDTAETIFKDIMLGWDTACCAPHLGGIWWDKAKSQKATASNAGPALAGIRLAKRTGKTAYLDFSKKVYAFWMSDMVDQTTFAIYDHLSTNGQRGAGALTYNHGLMIAAALELNDATGEAHYLGESNGFAHYMITTATRTSSAGPVLFDGTTCNGDCAAWKGIAYRYLAELFRHDPTHADYQNVLVSGANAVWTLARNPSTNFFSSSWAGPAATSGGVEAEGSGTMALNLYAMLCGVPFSAPSPGVYEAEEGFLDHVDFEANQGRAFLGLGYVSAFTKDKQGVSIDIQVEKAGTYSLAWRYTAGEGAGSRVVIVNGQTQPQALAFPATPSWTAWTNAESSAMLPAGKSTIGLYFDASRGSKTSLDIDQLLVTVQ